MTVEAGPGGARAGWGGEFRKLRTGGGDEAFASYRDMPAAQSAPEHRLIVDRSALLGAVNDHARSDVAAVLLSLGTDQVAVSAPGDSGGAVLPAVRQDALPLRIGFDPAVVAPALEAGVGPDILLEIFSATQPVVVRSADQGSLTTLVMPVALDDPR